MENYLHLFKDIENHDKAYSMESGGTYEKPWVGTIDGHLRGQRYFVSFNKNISPSKVSLMYTLVGGTTQIQIESDIPWSVSCDAPWISVSPLTGTTGISTLTVTATRNELENSRKAKIVLTGPHSLSTAIRVSQAANGLIVVPNIIWIDDFPDGTEYEECDGPYQDKYDPDFVECFYGYPDFDSYVEGYIDGIENGRTSSNCYQCTRKMLEFNGDVYFLYKHTDIDQDDPVAYGLLPVNMSYLALEARALETNHENHFIPFSYILNVDQEIYITENDGHDYILVRVEDPIEIDTSYSPPSIIWVDDFKDPEDIADDMGYNSFGSYMSDYLDEPLNFGSNRFVFLNETIEYDGTSYWLYEYDCGGNTENQMSHYGLLPMDSSYTSLYPESMEVDYYNRYQPFAYFLTWDMETLYWDRADGGVSDPESFVLVKVEE